MKKILVIPGDGVGPEVVNSSIKVIAAVTKEFEIIRADAGLNAFKKLGTTLSEEVVDNYHDVDAILMGPIYNGTAIKEYRSPEYDLIKSLNLPANVVSAKCMDRNSPFFSVDSFVITGNEPVNPIYEIDEMDGASTQIKVQYRACDGIFSTTKKFATTFDKTHITCVNYGKVFKLLSKRYSHLFSEAFENTEFETDVEEIEEFTQNTMSLTRTYDVIVTPMTYGRIVGSMYSSIVGGKFMTASIDYTMNGTCIYKPFHGTCDELAGKGLINPTGMIRSASLLLRNLGLKAESDKIENALVDEISEKLYHDNFSTSLFVKSLLSRIENQ